MMTGMIGIRLGAGAPDVPDGETAYVAGEDAVFRLSLKRAGLWLDVDTFGPTPFDPQPMYMLVAPGSSDRTSPEPPSGEAVVDRWDCGNAHETHGAVARATLRLIERNGIRDAEAMRIIQDLLHETGPAFTENYAHDQVPF